MPQLSSDRRAQRGTNRVLRDYTIRITTWRNDKHSYMVQASELAEAKPLAERQYTEEFPDVCILLAEEVVAETADGEGEHCH